MQCPKCPGVMELKTYGHKIQLHRCGDCGGLFCQPEVLVEMKREWMSEIVLDSVNRSLGRQLDKIEDIDCPDCGVPMDKTYDPHQRHIWYETCAQCEGMYFDAGEFTDLKYDTLMDRLRDVVRGARS